MMSERAPKYFVLDLNAYHEAAQRDELTAALLAVLDAFNWDVDELAKEAMALRKELWTPEKPIKKNRGAPDRWGAGNKFYAWLKLEIQLRADRALGHKGGIRGSLKRLFASLPRKDQGRLLVHWAEVPEDRHYCTKHTLKTYHADAAKMLAAGRGNVALWHQQADYFAARAVARAKKIGQNSSV